MNIELLAITRNAEKLIERAGRTAYLSFAKQGKGSEKKFIKLLLKGHISVLEHASATVRVRVVSRAFTHQMVRHRLCSFTQQSQRYVNEARFNYIEPESIKSNQEAHSLFVKFMENTKDVYARLQELGIKNEDARFVLPNPTESQIVVTANFRQWHHIIELRASLHAQWEIRKVASKILKILKKHAPTVFGDFAIDEEPAAAYTPYPFSCHGLGKNMPGNKNHKFYENQK